jgi:hypothetical protein
MNEGLLRFDPTIITVGEKRYIEVERETGNDRLFIDNRIQRVHCVLVGQQRAGKSIKEMSWAAPDMTIMIPKDSLRVSTGKPHHPHGQPLEFPYIRNS